MTKILGGDSIIFLLIGNKNSLFFPHHYKDPDLRERSPRCCTCMTILLLGWGLKLACSLTIHDPITHKGYNFSLNKFGGTTSTPSLGESHLPFSSPALISCVVSSVNFYFRRDSSISSRRASIFENFILSSSCLVACNSFCICLILS
jgi:hypothetical protein